MTSKKHLAVATAIALTFAGSASAADGGASIFAPFDQNGDGKTTKSEVRGYVEERVNRIDENGDGGLSVSEFEKALMKRKDSNFGETFNQADVNGDGSLSREEFREHMRATKLTPRAEKRVKSLDEDGDGKVGVDEAGGKLFDMFEKLDRDGDHAISVKSASNG